MSNRIPLENFDDLSRIIVIKVGEPAMKFHCPTKLLEQVPYFHALLKGEFKENREGVIELQDVDLTTFRYFLRWLYLRELDILKVGNKNVVEAHRLYIFADRMAWPDLKNTVLNKIGLYMHERNSSYSCSMVKLIFESTSPKDRIREYVVDNFFYRGKISWDKDAWNSEFLLSLVHKYHDFCWSNGKLPCFEDIPAISNYYSPMTKESKENDLPISK